MLRDPLRGDGNHLVLCQVLNANASAHAINRRATLRAVLDAIDTGADPWVGFEREYTLYRAGRAPTPIPTWSPHP